MKKLLSLLLVICMVLSFFPTSVFAINNTNTEDSFIVNSSDSNNPFVDVKETDFFYDSVMWAVGESITSGLDQTHFGPYAICNRAQVVTFLWRSLGEPAPYTQLCPFTDVPANSFYFNPVMWAIENGITNGTGSSTFSPNSSCQRAHVVTYLYRAAGYPEPTLMKNPFSDVTEDDFFYKAVLWAVQEGITTGTSDSTFSPYDECMRAQIVTFLWRANGCPTPKPIPNPDPTPDPVPDPTPDPDPTPNPDPTPEPDPTPDQPGTNIPPSDPTGSKYILNTETLKFHYESCWTVKRIDEENYHVYIGPRERLLEYNYSPCGHCDP